MGFRQQLWGKFSYNLRTQSDFSSTVPKTVKYGTETISFLAPKVWVLVPEKLKECSCLEAFKSKIWKWKPDCPCPLSMIIVIISLFLVAKTFYLRFRCTFTDQ